MGGLHNCIKMLLHPQAAPVVDELIAFSTADTRLQESQRSGDSRNSSTGLTVPSHKDLKLFLLQNLPNPDPFPAKSWGPKAPFTPPPSKKANILFASLQLLRPRNILHFLAGQFSLHCFELSFQANFSASPLHTQEAHKAFSRQKNSLLPKMNFVATLRMQKQWQASLKIATFLFLP